MRGGSQTPRGGPANAFELSTMMSRCLWLRASLLPDPSLAALPVEFSSCWFICGLCCLPC